MQVRRPKRPASWTGPSTCSTEGQDQQQRRREQQEAPPPASAKGMHEKGKKIKDDLDQLIDQIDEVLEENAEEFVRNYIQRGGQ